MTAREDTMRDLTARGKASADRALMYLDGAPDFGQWWEETGKPQPPGNRDPKALEALLKVDFVDYAGYHVGAQVIPKGNPDDQYLRSFQDAQRKIGGTDEQLAVLAGVREGRLPSERLPDAHLSGPDLLKCATLDANGEMHIGNLTIDKNMVKDVTKALQTQSLHDKQLVGDIVNLAESGRPQRIGWQQHPPIPEAEHLLAQARPLPNGDMQIQNVTIPRDEYANFALHLNNADEPQYLQTIEAAIKDGKSVKAPPPFTDRELGNRIREGVHWMTDQRDAASREVLSGVPDRLYGDLGKKDASVEMERTTDNAHVSVTVVPGGTVRGPNYFTGGTITSIESDGGFTTVAYNNRGHDESITYKDPLGVDAIGKEVHNPLHNSFENAKEGNQFKLQVGNDGVSFATQVIDRDGVPRREQVGEITPSWDRGQGQAQAVGR